MGTRFRGVDRRRRSRRPPRGPCCRLRPLRTSGQAPAGEARGGTRRRPVKPARGGATGGRVPHNAWDGQPNMNGVWQAHEYGELESPRSRGVGRSVLPDGRHRRESRRDRRSLKAARFRICPAAAAKQREELRQPADRGPRSQVLPAGHSARHLHALSVPDRPEPQQHPDGVRVRQRQPRRQHGQADRGARGQLDGLVERQAGRAIRWSWTSRA